MRYQAIQQIVDFVYAPGPTAFSTALWEAAQGSFPSETTALLKDKAVPTSRQRKKRMKLLALLDDKISCNVRGELLICGKRLTDFFSPLSKINLKRIRQIHVQVGAGACNFHCVFCYQQPQKKISFEKVYKVYKETLRFIKRYKVPRVILQGGEVTVDSAARPFVKKLMKTPCALYLITNGYQFDDFWQESCLRKDSIVQISLNASSPQAHGRICKEDAYATVLENINSFTEKRKKRQAECSLWLSMVVYDETWPDVIPFILKAKTLGADKILLKPRQYSTTYERNKTEPIAKMYFEQLLEHREARALVSSDNICLLASAIGYAKDLTDLPQSNRQNSLAEKETGGWFCDVPFNEFFIDEGAVSSCCYSSYVFGDLENEKLENIINNPASRLVREKMLGHDLFHCPDVCDLKTRIAAPA